MQLDWFALVGSAIYGEIRVDATTVTLAVIAAILGLLLLKKTYEERTPSQDHTQAAQPRMIPASEADPRLLAVLVAAAATMVGKPVAVRRITFINRDTVSGWAEAGRTSIHQSHNPRRN